MTASLYIHIPFCAANEGGGTCDYCDFFSVAVDTQKNAALLDSFIEVLLNDIEEQIAFFNVDYIPTIYIGGGTPSVLGAKRIERLLSGLQKLVSAIKTADTNTIGDIKTSPISRRETLCCLLNWERPSRN